MTHPSSIASYIGCPQDSNHLSLGEIEASLIRHRHTSFFSVLLPSQGATETITDSQARGANFTIVAHVQPDSFVDHRIAY